MDASTERTYGLFLHLSAFSGFIIPLATLFAPLILWLIKRHESEYVDAHGKAAVNFQISYFIYAIVSSILIFVFIGFVLVFIVGIAGSYSLSLRPSKHRTVSYTNIRCRFHL
ncbi:hypothetical protein JCM19037_770 [Geomicrobium sp. JCM 19037]|nr:hypothetical protein JCM19037_770 [Geomicrobium sp. JCM 19037]